MMNPLTVFLTMLFLGLSTPPLYAADLAGALSAKQVCELPSGYIQATPGNEAEMACLVADVNNKRARVYADIAAAAPPDADGNRIDAAGVGAENARQEKAANPGKFCQ